MKALLLAGATTLALTFGASAQTNTDTNTNTPPAPAASPSAPAASPSASTSAAASGQFITQQQVGQVRAPKLVGVSVYDKDNKNVGKISDLLLDKDGKVEAVVIGVGGFLGIGAKDVALPYDQVKWQTEQRTVATNTGAAPGAATGTSATGTSATGTSATGTGGMNGSATTANSGAAQKTVTPEQQEAYNGYPDRAVVEMSQQQLKDAPEFKYASQTANSAAEVNATAK